MEVETMRSSSKALGFVLLAILILPVWARSQTLHNRCNEARQNVTLTGSDEAGDGRIWNVTRNGVKRWNYEGSDYELPLNDAYNGDFELALDSFGCSDHFNFYYTEVGDHRVTAADVERFATRLEAAWSKFADEGFRTPLELKADRRYTVFTDFTRIPVLILNTYDGKSHANGTPIINLIPGAGSGTPHHELFHVIKHGYTTFNPAWLNEGLARWSEKLIDGVAPPCSGLDDYNPATFTFFSKKYCDTARFFEYMALKYGRVGTGSDVVIAILEEMADLTRNSTNQSGMRAVERAVDGFRGGAAAVGQSYREWAKGNYVDDTGANPVLRSQAPRRPRWTEAGEFGWGRDKYTWHEFPFTTRSRGTITIQIRAAAGDFVDGDDDDDDMRFRLDGTLLGDWNTSNAVDGAVLDGKIRTLHIVRRDVMSGAHTLTIEADEYPVLFAVNVFVGEVPLLLQRSGLFKWCTQAPLYGWLVPCFSEDGDPPILSRTFTVPAGGVSQTSVVLEGRASNADQNEEAGYAAAPDDARVLIDGTPLSFFSSETSLFGNYLDGQVGAVELRGGALAAGEHTLEILTRGKPYIDHVALSGTSAFLPLFRLNGGRLSSWSTNYHVTEVTRELLPSNDEVLAPRDLRIELGTYTWSHDLEPPFYYVLLIDSAGDLVETLTPEGHGATLSVTPRTLRDLGVGGRVVVVVGTTNPSGTYYVRVSR
jgi:hypothetical protein